MNDYASLKRENTLRKNELLEKRGVRNTIIKNIDDAKNKLRDYTDKTRLNNNSIDLLKRISSERRVSIVTTIEDITTRVVQQVFNGEEVKMKYKWKNLEDISAKMPLAVIASEDSHFKTHYGFDVDAIYHAYKSNQKKGKKIVKGGSTISQQTAKNVFLWPGRSWIRKGLEVYFTVLIETLWGKKRIIEMYLNVIEMGNGIYGTEAAARKYFDKPAKKLTKYECAAITSVLPSPRKWSVSKPSAFVRKKQQRIVTGMNFMKNVKF